jgi:heptose I phosphotransferase
MLLKLSDTFRDLGKGKEIFDSILNLEGHTFRSHKNRRTFRITVNGKGYFVKTHRGTGWSEIFKNVIQLKLPVLSSQSEVRAINRLEELGIPTMKMAGYGLRGIPPAWLDSFIITEELENSVSLEVFCKNWSTQDFSMKLAIIIKIADIAKRLHANGVNHRDFYLCHFFIDLAKLDNNCGCQNLVLYLIDLHRVQLRGKTPARWIVKDLAALLFSAADIGLTRKDIFRFMKAYSGKSLRNTLADDHQFWNRIRTRAEKLIKKHAGSSEISGTGLFTNFF